MISKSANVNTTITESANVNTTITESANVITTITEKPQVLLLYPKTGMDFGSTIAPPHAHLSIAAPLLQAGYRVKILDQRVEPITEEILSQYISSDLICCGISTMSGSQIYFALMLAKMMRSLTDGDVPLVWGGCHPSVVPEQTIENENVDYVVVGEGDYIFMELIEHFQGLRKIDDITGIVYKNDGEITNTAGRPLLEVDELLDVPWELVNVEKYIHRDMYIQDRTRVLDIGQTSRGCPFNCGFCSSASIRKRRWRPVDPEITVDRITNTVNRFKLDGFWLRDDEFYIFRKRANAIFEGMIKNQLDVRFYTSGTRCDVFEKASSEEVKLMKQAGAHTLKFGAESGNQRVLDLMIKGITVEQTLKANQKCKEHGITPCFGLMIGYPTEQFHEIDDTLDLATQIKKQNSNAELETMATYTALPGTPDWELALKHGLNPPNSLEEWIEWNFDEYDLEGKKIPWYQTKKERIWIGNISYMSILANALGNVAGSVKNKAIRLAGKMVSKPVSAYYSERLKRKSYRFAPELAMVRTLRENIFYKNEKTIN